jgi:hypothetical protein
MMKTLAIAGAYGGVLIAPMGCSVGMAMSGKEEPNLGAFRVGSPRGEVELQLGSPVSTVTNPDGGQTDIYEYELGNKPSAGRAAAHAAMDVLTLGIWEIVGTPIEAFQGETHRLMIVYDAQDRVVSMNRAAPSAEGSPTPHAPQVTPPAGNSVGTGSVQALVERNNKNLLQLRVGMPQADVHTLMGDPEASEGYSWGAAWLYRTAVPTTAQGTAAEWTPVVFNEKGILIGWGRNVLAEGRER